MCPSGPLLSSNLLLLAGMSRHGCPPSFLCEQTCSDFQIDYWSLTSVFLWYQEDHGQEALFFGCGVLSCCGSPPARDSPLPRGVLEDSEAA